MYKIPPRASSKGYKYAAACRPARARCAPQKCTHAVCERIATTTTTTTAAATQGGGLGRQQLSLDRADAHHRAGPAPLPAFRAGERYAPHPPPARLGPERAGELTSPTTFVCTRTRPTRRLVRGVPVRPGRQLGRARPGLEPVLCRQARERKRYAHRGRPRTQNGAPRGHGSRETLSRPQPLLLRARLIRAAHQPPPYHGRRPWSALLPGQHVFVGMGFQERTDAFDFNVTIQDHFKCVSLRPSKRA